MKTLLSAALAACLAVPAFAGDMAKDTADAMHGETKVMIADPYARASGPSAKAGAAFMTIMNMSDTDDRLVAASSDVSERVELHTHLEDANGVMRMVEVEDGFAVPAGGQTMLARGGAHVMFMGLKQPFVNGETIEVTLTFEQAGDMTVEIPIDLDRKADHGMGHGAHGGHGDHSGHATN
ncbi:MAG: copper chaperone PCu(A)C [Pseudomonadota bacterium]